MNKKKQIQNAEWQERIQTFSSGNRGRKAAIATEGITLVENQVLRDIEYDPIGKGNDLIITLGYVENIFTHTIDAPVEFYLHQDSSGVVTALEVVDEKGGSTFLRLMN